MILVLMQSRLKDLTLVHIITCAKGLIEQHVFNIRQMLLLYHAKWNLSLFEVAIVPYFDLQRMPLLHSAIVTDAFIATFYLVRDILAAFAWHVP